MKPPVDPDAGAGSPGQELHALPEVGGFSRYFAEHRQVGWIFLLAVLGWGVFAFRSLPQQEDPPLPGRIARVVTVFPGATALEVEQLVTKRVEEKIAEVESVAEVSSESRAGFSIISLGQRSAPPWKIEQEWGKLRGKLVEISLPEGCRAAELKTDFGDVVTMLLAVTRPAGGADPDAAYRELEPVAAKLESELRRLSTVGRVRRVDEVSESVHVEISPPKMQALGVSVPRLMEALRMRNQLIPAGTLRGGDRAWPVEVSGEFENEDEVAEAIVGATAEGAPIRLSDFAEVRREYGHPAPLTVDILHRPQAGGPLQRQPSLMFAVEMRSGQVIGELGEQVRGATERLRPGLPAGVEIVTLSDQPASVAGRIHQFSKCFAEALLVVMLVAVLLMEWRAALVLAASIVLTIAMTLGGMQLAGLELHQISIAALIIALGMLVDDPVVATDGINRELAGGASRVRAAWLGPWRLRRPILYATIINIVAFLPLLLLPGDKKTFIFALPVVVTIALVVSRLVSLTFVPLLGFYLLRGQAGFDTAGQLRRAFPLSLVDGALALGLRGYRAVLEWALRRPWLAVFIAYALLADSFALAPFFGHQFFPAAERNQCLVDIALPESSSLAATRGVCERVTTVLAGHEEIVSAAIFLGGSAPRFYYNLTPKAPGDHLAAVLINTRTAEDVPGLVERLRRELDTALIEARCVAKQLEQGPPMETPIQVQISGGDLDQLHALAEQAARALKRAGAYKVHDDLGTRLPSLKIELEMDRAAALGVVKPQIAFALRSAFAEVKVAEITEAGRVTPVALRLSPALRVDAETLAELAVESLQQRLIPLSQFAKISEAPEYPSISHQDGRRTVTVKAYAASGELAQAALDRARPALEAIARPAGYTLAYAGEARELTNSRREMAGVMAISLALIALAMVMQFQSVLKSLVVMLTVPLGLIGGFAGLALFHAPLGFMAMLAFVSLAGVIVSHIIVLSDFIEEAREAGVELKAALIQAGLVRLRPVLVTVLATAGGLVPLALSGGELWRPLTAIHIFGLLGATALTLFALPVLYYLVERRRERVRGNRPASR